jgi:hypothetical protein
MLAYDYPLLGMFWTLLWFFLWIAWIWLMIMVVFDIFRSHDMGGWGKALWAIFVIIIPWLGVLVYLIARGDKMRQHAVADAQARDDQVRTYVRDAAGSSSTAEEISKLASLRDQGVLSDDEFQAQKTKLLAT